MAQNDPFGFDAIADQALGLLVSHGAAGGVGVDAYASFFLRNGDSLDDAFLNGGDKAIGSADLDTAGFG